MGFMLIGLVVEVEAYKSSKLMDVHWLRFNLNKEATSND